LNRFEVAQGSSITLVQNIDNYQFSGIDYTIAFEGYQADNTAIRGANVSGIVTGNGGSLLLISCQFIGATTLPETACIDCALAADITLSEAGTFMFERCFSAVAGTSAPSLDFGAVGNQNVNFRHYSGGIEVKRVGVSGTDNMSLEGWGQYILNANCTGGTIAVRGHFKKTDNSGGSVTLDEDANFLTNVIHSDVAQGSGTGNNQIQLATTASATDGAYDPAEIFIVNGTGTGQTRLILEYNGTSKTATVDRNWKVNPSTDSEYRVIASSGREHVNEGLAQAGAATTITLNALASSDDDAYNGQIIFLRSGTGEDQARIVSDYVGATKVATVSAWDTTPDSTTGYVMLPYLSSGAGGGGDATEANQLLMMGSGFNTSTDSLEAIRNRGDVAWITSGSAGSGAWSVTITVNDGTNPLENASVRMTNGAETYIATTNAAGQASFSLDSATWTVSITKSLYSFTPTTLAISANTSQAYSMTQIVISLSDPGFTTGYYFCYDEDGNVESGVEVSVKLYDLPGTGISPDTAIRTETSDASGLVEFTNMFRASTYKIRRGADRPWQNVAVPLAAGATYALTNIGGIDG